MKITSVPGLQSSDLEKKTTLASKWTRKHHLCEGRTTYSNRAQSLDGGEFGHSFADFTCPCLGSLCQYKITQDVDQEYIKGKKEKKENIQRANDLYTSLQAAYIKLLSRPIVVVI